jgi:polygalacturonase
MLPTFLLRAHISTLCFLAFVRTTCAAQDTRTVTEPVVPPVCATLKAQISAQHGTVAETDEHRLDTLRIQEAVDSCAPGKAVELRAEGDKSAFLSGPLELRHGITLLVDGGVTLFGSRDPRQYDAYPGVCGTVTTENRRGCKPLIHAGDTDAAVIGDGVIDGRGGAKLMHADVSWWDLAQEAKVKNAYQNCPRIIVADRADNFILYRITLKNSPNFHVIVNRTNGFTAWGVKIDSPKTARNTDGIDPSSSTNVSILHSYIHAGDDNVAIKAGSNGPASHITIADDHFYTGHGMSIGSETNGGVEAVEVRDLTIDGADNGIRIKSNSTRGGTVRNITYSNVCIRNVKEPLVFDPFYSTERGTDVPSFEEITLHGVGVLTPGKMTFVGSDAQHLLRIRFDGLRVESYDPKQVRAANARIAIGPGGSNFALAGENVVVAIEGNPGNAIAPSCDGRFVPFPEDSASHAGKTQTSGSITVAADGSGDYKHVQEAVNSLPDTGGTIHIRPGTYREVVEISKPNVRLIGDAKDPAAAVIVFDKSAATAGGTFKTATVSITGDSFYAEGITFQNDFSSRNPTATQGAQAVALSVRGDRAVFRHVRILGAQDTLFAAAKSCASDTGPCVPARQYFDDCYIEGHVDFIFGDGKAFFRNCEIHAIAHKTVYLTAQSKRYPEQESGYVFDHCKVTGDPSVSELYLGRPWRPYSTAVFLDADLQATVVPAGWHEWHSGETHSLDTAYYAEYHSSGPGANPGSRDPHSHQLADGEAQKFSLANFLGGTDRWNPEAASN